MSLEREKERKREREREREREKERDVEIYLLTKRFIGSIFERNLERDRTQSCRSVCLILPTNSDC